MGVSDRIPLQLPLTEMYVPLKARIEMPGGETWSRNLRVAGRNMFEDEVEDESRRLSEPTSILKLLQDHDGLILLGDPGSGKTTFLKYLALKLSQAQGNELGLAARLPVLVPLSAYANALADKGAIALNGFLAQHYHDRGIELPIEGMLEKTLVRGGALLLLDGLDELRDLRYRCIVVNRVVDFFNFHRQRGNKFVITSRIVGYREVRPAIKGLVECTLADFEDEEITSLIEKWTTALEKAAQGDSLTAVYEAATEKEELLEAVGRNSGVRRLASNPLLLTILALMKRQDVGLAGSPGGTLQEICGDTAQNLEPCAWVGSSSRSTTGRNRNRKDYFRFPLWMHETNPGKGLVKREALRRRLEAIYQERGVADRKGRRVKCFSM